MMLVNLFYCVMIFIESTSCSDKMAAVRLLFRPRPIVRASCYCTPRYSTAVEPECELKNLDNEATGTLPAVAVFGCTLLAKS